MVEVRELNKNFKKKQVLHNINIKFDTGVYGLLGTNGAGKTTLLRCLTLLYAEGLNSVYYNGIIAQKNKAYLNEIGYLPQQFGLFSELTLFEGMQLLANFKNIEKNKSSIEIERCLELVNLMEEHDKKIGELSGGMVRRFGIAQALLNNPDVIIFDEPTAGLDPIERLRFKSIIAKLEKNKTIIISTHIVEDIDSICDYAVIIDAGRIITCMSCEALQEYAEGKVYEIPEADFNKTEGKTYKVKTYDHKGSLMVRFLSSKKQDFPLCKATIEDGYLCIIKGI